MERLLDNLRALMAGTDFPWAVCGGYALELFAGRRIRPHGDVDICVPEAARAQVIRHMLRQGWRVLEYRGMGKVRPLVRPENSEKGRNLMCLTGECELVRFFPSDEDGLLYHQFLHTGMTSLSFLDVLFCDTEENTLVFHRQAEVALEWTKAVLRREGTPFLAPEIALLHKAQYPQQEQSRLDYAAVYPQMNDEQKRWFRAALTALYPQGHIWNDA